MSHDKNIWGEGSNLSDAEKSCLHDSERVTSQVESCWTPDTHQLGKGDTLAFSAFANEVFHDSSIGKYSACNAGDPSSSPGLERKDLLEKG